MLDETKPSCVRMSQSNAGLAGVLFICEIGGVDGAHCRTMMVSSSSSKLCLWF